MIAALLLVVQFEFGAVFAKTSADSLVTPDLTCRVRDKDGALVRSMVRRNQFRRMVGRDGKDPECRYVNHIVPLRCGGCDVPSNMECMSEAEWKARTGPERNDCGRHPGGEWRRP